MSLPVPSASRGTGRWDPFRELDELYERMKHLSETGGAADGADRWVPLADIEETDDADTIELELPGVKKDDGDSINANLDGGVLTIRVPKSQQGRSRRIAING
jgi:HSP20 family protein